MGFRITDVPDGEPRKSKFDLDFLIKKFSYLNNNKEGLRGEDFSEMLLCLANEIKELKNRMNDYIVIND